MHSYLNNVHKETTEPPVGAIFARHDGAKDLQELCTYNTDIDSRQKGGITSISCYLNDNLP